MRHRIFASGHPATSEDRTNSATPTSGASRREFMTTLAVAGAGAMLPAGGALNLAAQVTRSARGRIDVHHHMAPPAYVRAMDREIAPTAGYRNWSPAVSLEKMDKANVATSILSPIQGLVRDSLSDRSERARNLARQNNEYGAQVVRDKPDRFGLFATLPMPDVDGSLKEIAYALDTLKADGFGLFSSYMDKWPGDPAFAPVFDELNRRKAVVFFHPAHHTCCRNMEGLTGTIEFDIDTARAIDNLLLSGTLSRCPDVKLIFTHAGGAFTTLAPRMIDDFPKRFESRVPHGVEYEFKKLFFDTAHAGAAAPLDALKDVVPTSQILYGSDVPIREYPLTDDKLEQYGGFSPDEWRAVNRGNAERLFPRLKA
jgi:predicted TIM-barrel fold metal-dependent hydrolase